MMKKKKKKVRGHKSLAERKSSRTWVTCCNLFLGFTKLRFIFVA
jgi:hypothetical protein